MERIEMVEKLREKADITMEEARDVLERNSWDILDALVELEKQGKVQDGVRMSAEAKDDGQYETVHPTAAGKEFSEENGKRKKEKKDHECGKIRRVLKKIFRITLDNHFLIKRNGEILIKVPVLVPVFCVIVNVWITVILLFVGLLLNCRYSFEGKELGTDRINESMEKTGEFAQKIVNEFTSEDENRRE